MVRLGLPDPCGEDNLIFKKKVWKDSSGCFCLGERRNK